jgi:hypothetical protein
MRRHFFTKDFIPFLATSTSNFKTETQSGYNALKGKLVAYTQHYHSMCPQFKEDKVEKYAIRLLLSSVTYAWGVFSS